MKLKMKDFQVPKIDSSPQSDIKRPEALLFRPTRSSYREDDYTNFRVENLTVKEESDSDNDEDQLTIVEPAFDDSSEVPGHETLKPSTKCDYNHCLDIRDHQNICQCSTPRLHLYILTRHKCTTKSCFIKPFEQIPESFKMEFQNKRGNELSNSLHGSIIECEVSESEFKNIVNGEVISLKDDTPRNHDDQKVQKPNHHLGFKVFNSKRRKVGEALKINSSLFDKKTSKTDHHKLISASPKKSSKHLIRKENFSNRNKNLINNKSDGFSDGSYGKTKIQPKYNNDNNNKPMKKGKLLFRINKNGTFHSFNQNPIKISSVSTLNQIEEADQKDCPKLPIKTEVSEELQCDGSVPKNSSGAPHYGVPESATKTTPKESVDLPQTKNDSSSLTPMLKIQEIKEEPKDSMKLESSANGSVNLEEDPKPKQANNSCKLEAVNDKKRNPDPIAKCNLCMIDFKSFLELIDHLDKHQKEGLIFCYYCQKSFGDKTTMKRHLRIHTGERPYKCSICEKSFSLPGNFKKHRDIHADIRKEKCDICGRMFRRKEHLKQHRLRHTGEKPYDCSLCGSRFTAKYSLQIHMNNHLGRKPYTCSYCGKAFSDKSTMKKHIRIHTGERPYNCNICNKAFSESGSLSIHVTTHSQDRPYHCELCPVTFKSSKSLRQHIKIHFGDKQFVCKYCGMAFIQKYNMTMHERIHTGERPYECYECNRRFRSRSCLGKHVVLHGGDTEKKHSCEYCEKRFHRKAHLQRHISTHMGVKNFECNVCFKKFSIKTTLKKHVLNFHSQGARSFPCLFCGKIFKRRIYVTTHKCSKRPKVKNEPLDNQLIDTNANKGHLEMDTVLNS